MTIKYYLGMDEVPRSLYEATKTKELAAGNGIKSSREVDGAPEYTLENGIVIRGNGQGGFNRVENGKLMEAWIPGTANEWVQQEPTNTGQADFFCKAD